MLTGCVIVITISDVALLFLDHLASGPCWTVVEVIWRVRLLFGTTTDLSFLGGIILYLGVHLLLALINCHGCDGQGLLPLTKVVGSQAGAKLELALYGEISMLDEAVEQIK